MEPAAKDNKIRPEARRQRAKVPLIGCSRIQRRTERVQKLLERASKAFPTPLQRVGMPYHFLMLAGLASPGSPRQYAVDKSPPSVVSIFIGKYQRRNRAWYTIKSCTGDGTGMSAPSTANRACLRLPREGETMKEWRITVYSSGTSLKQAGHKGGWCNRASKQMLTNR